MALLERPRQLEELTGFTAGAHCDGGGVVLIGGEPGIGRSTLVRAFLRELDRPHLIGSCEPLTTPRPLPPARPRAPER